MYDYSKPGHLLIFTKESRRYFLYLYVKDIETPFSSLIVLPGIRKIAEGLSIELEIKQFPEFKRIPIETGIKEEIIIAPVEIFTDSSGNFKESLSRMCLENLLSGYNSIFPVREIGAVARDYSFVRYRENFDTVIHEFILKRKNVIIDAPRRAGKTSFMRQLVKETELKDYKTYYIDMENARNPVQFSAILVTAFKEKKFDSELDKIKSEIKIGREIRPNYRQKVEEELKNPSKKAVILAIDECSFLIEEMYKEEKDSSKIADFLKWFKHVRQTYKNIRFVFSGSIKFSVFKKILGENELFSDCYEYSLQPFDKESAGNLVEGLFYSEEIYPPDYVVKEILRLATPYFPYFLQMVTDEMVKFYRSTRKFPNKEKIHSIIDNEIIGTSCRRYLDQLLIHLRRYNDNERIGARAVLDHLAIKGKEKLNNLEAIYTKATGTTVDFEKTLSLLEYDFYIEEKSGGYQFNNEIIKNWWKVNFAVTGEID
jgi:hypothetical protein